MKLRKHLRTRRVEKIEMLGADRLVVLTCGSGPVEHKLIVELYYKGNTCGTRTRAAAQLQVAHGAHPRGGERRATSTVDGACRLATAEAAHTRASDRQRRLPLPAGNIVLTDADHTILTLLRNSKVNVRNDGA